MIQTICKIRIRIIIIIMIYLGLWRLRLSILAYFLLPDLWAL
jgi:hypothetical protein